MQRRRAVRREYVEGHASLCGGGATKGLRARLMALEEGLEFDDVVRYRKLGRALHTHNTGGSGGCSARADKGGDIGRANFNSGVTDSTGCHDNFIEAELT